MALVEVHDIEKAYAGRSILRGISFDLQPGQRIGLVGPNGAGKSTLLKIMAGVERTDTGSVSISKNCKFAYVSQIPTLDPEETLRHQVTLVFDELHEIERQMHAAADDMGKHPSGPEHDKALERYGECEHQFQHMGGWDIERRVDMVLQQLGFAERDLNLPIKALSGGQKSRAQIARLLLEGPDLMLLDEPTNHLDLPMLDWLENTLNEMNDITLVVVSHDRYFLDSVVDEIYDMQGGQIEAFPGNYSAFTTLKAEREMARERAFSQQQSYIAKQEEYIRRFGAGQRAMQARGRKTRLERLKDESTLRGARKDPRKMILNLKVPKPSGHDALKVEGLSKAFPNKELFKNIEIHLERGKRLGIIGPNGSGKTTLLNIIAEAGVPIGAPSTGATADDGKIKWGYGVALKYYQQEHQDLNPVNTVIDELQQARITATQQELHDLAALFLFTGDTIEKKVGVLSGGEKARVSLAKLLMNPANTILMDEPTNHLDMATAEVLENALDSYDGTLILVSHDRYFMDQVCDMLLVLQPNRMAGHSDADIAAAGTEGLTWKLYSGSYTEYLAHIAREKAEVQELKRVAEQKTKQKEQERQQAEKARLKAEANKKVHPKPKAKIHPKFAKFSVQQLEEQIMEMEVKIANLEGCFGDPKIAADAERMHDLQQTYKQHQADLAAINAAWEAKAETN